MERKALLVTLVAIVLSLVTWASLTTQETSANTDDSGSLVKRHQQKLTALKEDRFTEELQYGEFTMLTFAVLSLPAEEGSDGTYNRGVVSEKSPLGSGPAVWETMKNSTEIYRARGATPAPWQTVNEFPDDVTPRTTAQLRAEFGQTNSPWLHFLSSSRMIDGQQIADPHGNVLWYDVRCNQDYFNYVTASKYPLFNLEGQEAARTDSSFEFDFPQDAIEIKGTWRILGKDDDDSKYWTAYGAYYDAENKLQYARIGLTALHIISHAQSNWVWMTFEQVDNPSTTFQYFLEEPGDAIGTNQTANPLAAPINDELQLLTRNTKWQNYRVIGWQFDEVREDGSPVILANSNIETYFPTTSSCMTCHAMANIGPPENRRLNMWLTDESGIQGRVGTVDFNEVVKGMNLNPSQFKQMNYVWSLREAQSTGVPIIEPKPESR